jgi:RND family efflux transporter MFP subunit
MNRRLLSLVLLFTLPFTGCGKKEEQAQFYSSTSLGNRDIIVAVEAAGVIEPVLTVDVKSKASGEILSFDSETGDVVEAGTMLVQIDERAPTNTLAQNEALLEAAIARRTIAETQARRAAKLFEAKTYNEQENEQAILELANAKAEVVRYQVAVENARIALEDTVVRAPMTGTVIEKLVEKGQVISSPTMDVGGGSLLMRMADLSSVQVKILVNETDVGKVTPDQSVTITVAAYPNQPFQGVVKKIEPKAESTATVTTFSVLVVLDNKFGLLRPGMNADVEIRIEEKYGILAVPTMALRTIGDIPVSAQLVGMPEDQVRSQLGLSTKGRFENGAGKKTKFARRPGTEGKARPRREGDAGKGAGYGRSTGYEFSNRYWVFRTLDDGSHEAVNIITGLTDLEYNEVLEGLNEGDEVLLLPSSGLVMDQQYFQQMIRRYTSMPGMGGSKRK